MRQEAEDNMGERESLRSSAAVMWAGSTDVLTIRSRDLAVGMQNSLTCTTSLLLLLMINDQ